MFLDWWMIVVVWIVAFFWGEWRYKKGMVDGCELGLDHAERERMEDNGRRMEAFIEELKLQPDELQKQSIALYLYTAKLKVLGLLKFHSDGTMEGYNGKRVKLVETVEGQKDK